MNVIKVAIFDDNDTLRDSISMLLSEAERRDLVVTRKARAETDE